MALKEFWWCIREECNHHNTHDTFKGSVITTRCCKHPVAVNSSKCKTPTLGLEISKMDMCPVLYDLYLKD